MRPLLAVLGLAAVVAGCAPAARQAPVAPAPRDEQVVLLPGADGRTGALTVTHGDRTLTLDQPYATATVKQEGSLEAGGVSAEEAQARFGPALAALPPRPVTFVVHFLGNSDEFTAESRLEIAKILPEIAARPAPEIVVVGHTDRMGTLPHNDALSLRRAERVRADLVLLGVPRESIQVAGRGEREPLVPTADEVPEPRNRRVEITVR
jgi:outer membrane protein OmpA-like peptidoglycan-associated protein